MNAINIKESIDKIKNLDELFANQEQQQSEFREILQRGYAIEETLPQNTILFVGMNPSFKEGDASSSFYYSEYDNAYFSRIKKITELVNQSLGTSFPFAHHDLYFVRHTSQEKVMKMKSAMKDFFDIQLNISKDIITASKPKLIVVANAEASKIFQNEVCKNWQPGSPFQWNNDLGVDFVEIETDGKSYRVPVLFTGMISGQRALDDGSYYSLIWHICHILRSIITFNQLISIS